MSPSATKHIVHFGFGHEARANILPRIVNAGSHKLVGITLSDTLQSVLQDKTGITALLAMEQPEDQQAIINHIASNNTDCITLTITQAGYCHEPRTNTLDIQRQDVATCTPTKPKTALGFLAAGLEQRRLQGEDGLTIIACDNLTNNGPLLQKMLASYAKRHDMGALAAWIGQKCTFPIGVLDQRVPATPEQYRTKEHGWPITAETYSKWWVSNSDHPVFPAALLQNLGVEILPLESTQHFSLRYVESQKAAINAGYFAIGLVGQLCNYQALHETTSSAAWNTIAPYAAAVMSSMAPDDALFDRELALARLLPPDNPDDMLSRFTRKSLYKICKICDGIEHVASEDAMPLLVTVASWLHHMQNNTPSPPPQTAIAQLNKALQEDGIESAVDQLFADAHQRQEAKHAIIQHYQAIADNGLLNTLQQVHLFPEMKAPTMHADSSPTLRIIFDNDGVNIDSEHIAMQVMDDFAVEMVNGLCGERTLETGTVFKEFAGTSTDQIIAQLIAKHGLDETAVFDYFYLKEDGRFSCEDSDFANGGKDSIAKFLANTVTRETNETFKRELKIIPGMPEAIKELSKKYGIENIALATTSPEDRMNISLQCAQDPVTGKPADLDQLFDGCRLVFSGYGAPNKYQAFQDITGWGKPGDDKTIVVIEDSPSSVTKAKATFGDNVTVVGTVAAEFFNGRRDDQAQRLMEAGASIVITNPSDLPSVVAYIAEGMKGTRPVSNTAGNGLYFKDNHENAMVPQDRAS